MSTWKLEHSTLKFLLKMTLNTTTYDRILPYSKEYFKPQPRFLRYNLGLFSLELHQIDICHKIVLNRKEIFKKNVFTNILFIELSNVH